MAQLRTTFDYRVRGLLVSRDLLGATVPVHHPDNRTEIVFPVRSTQPGTIPRDDVEEDLFPPDDPPFPMQAGGGFASTSIGIPLSDSDWAPIHFLRVHVYRNASAEMDAASAVLRESGEVADRVVQRVVEWLRVDARHPWLGLGGERPEGIGTATIVDLDAHERLAVTLGRARPVLRRVDPSEVLRREGLRMMLSRIEADDEPPLADSLLADALFYLEAEPTDPARAVLTASIACEVKVRGVLRARVDPTAEELLDVLLSNPRDWSLAAAALFHKPMRAIVGRSLNERGAEPPLKDVERLFTLRNDVAHRGRRPTDEEASAALRTAVRAFRWLEGVLAEA